MFGLSMILAGCKNEMDNEYTMEVKEVVKADDGTYLAYCKKSPSLYNYYLPVETPEKVSDKLIAKKIKEEHYWLIGSKKVTDHKYAFVSWVLETEVK